MKKVFFSVGFVLLLILNIAGNTAYANEIEENISTSSEYKSTSTDSSNEETTMSSSFEELTEESDEVDSNEKEKLDTQIGEKKAEIDLFQGQFINQGVYQISSYSGSTMLNIEKGTKNSKAKLELNLQMYTEAQQFELIPVENNWFIIKNINSGLVLDIPNGAKDSFLIVQQYTRNNTDAQKWQFVDAGEGYFYIQSKLGKVLDCTGGKLSAGTKIQTYELNHTNAQKWKIENVSKPSLIDIQNGNKQITGSETDKVISINNMTFDNWKKISLRSSTFTTIDQFKAEKTPDNWYVLKNVYSNKVLDIPNGSSDSELQLQQYDYNGSNAQKFRFIDAGSGYVYIQNRLGKVLDRKGGSNAEGAAIQTYNLNYSSAQKWKFENPQEPKTVSIQDGSRYFITSNINVNMVIDIQGGSTSNFANVHLWTENAVSQQKFVIKEVNDGWYKLENEKSRKVLDVAGGSKNLRTNVHQYNWNNTDAQKFRFIDAGNGLCYIQSKLGTYLDISNSENRNGANVQTYELNRSNAQKFKLDDLHVNNYIRTTKLNKSDARITIFNPNNGNVSSVVFPTWSRKNGQDDIKWLSGIKNGDGSWSTVVKSRDFKDFGIFDTHIYSQKGSSYDLLGKAEYSLEKSISPIQQHAINALNQVGWDLRAAFNWSTRIKYQTMALNPPAGNNFADWYAKHGFETARGNCYVYASTFYHMAKQLGYDAHVVSGKVNLAGGGSGPHGWVEINMNGTVYVFDPESHASLGSRGYNGYQIRYGAPGTLKYQSYQRVGQGEDYK